MPELPTGTVTLLFSDIEGSTLLVRELGERYTGVLAEHRRALRTAFANHGGVEVDTQGDSFFVVFERATDAVAAAAAAQHALSDSPVRVRIGLHTGEPVATAEGYVGLDVVRGARIGAVGHGGQVLLSQTTRDLIEDEVRDLGKHRLKDLPAPERIYQLGGADFPPLRSLNQTNVALQPTTLIGRRRELTEVRELLADERVRLLTLVGAPGAGKTRLALQVAGDSVEEFPGGVFLVGLAPISDPELVEPTIAQTLGVRDGLEEYLRERKALLVLDNFEQVVAAAPRVAELLAAAPEVKVLATSREPLGVAGERRFPVPPLSESEAVALFTDRARAVQPRFTPSEAVAEICRRLDRLPLAIELAAARTNVLSAEALLERLDRRLPLLTGGPRDAPERQQTLRATIEWSYELLDPQERRLFAQLGVFASGFTLEAAEHVCDADLDTLATLADKSLIVAADDRFTMLETIREYALERLTASDQLDEAAQRHANYLFEFARGLDQARPTVAGWRRVRERVAPDAANVRAAIEWALRSEPSLALRLCLTDATEGFPLAAQAAWLNRALAETPHVEPETRAGAFRLAASLHNFLGEPTQAATLLERSLELFRELNDKGGELRVLRDLAQTFVSLGKIEDARSLGQRSLALAEDLGDNQQRYRTLHTLGDLERHAGRLETAAELLGKSVEMARSSGDLPSATFALLSLGDVCLLRGDLDAAVARYDGSLALARALILGADVESTAPLYAFERTTIYCLAGLAAVAARHGDIERAGRLWGAVEGLEDRLRLPLLPHDRARYEATLAELSRPEFEAALRAGEALTLEQAVEEALNHPSARMWPI